MDGNGDFNEFLINVFDIRNFSNDVDGIEVLVGLKILN